MTDTSAVNREAGALHSIVSQLNWRGDNKFVHLQGASPMLPPDHLPGAEGLQTLRRSIYDFSVRQPRLTDKVGLLAHRAPEPFG